MTCYRTETFADYFEENMNAMSVPYPKGWFSTAATAVGTTQQIVTPMIVLGKSATMGEVIGATKVLEKFSVVRAMLASANTGLIIGSIVVATGRVLGCGAKIEDAFVFNTVQGINHPNLNVILNTYPGVLDPSVNGRIGYGHMIKVA